MASEDEKGEVPYYLMPIAALVGSFAVMGSLRVVWFVYRNVTYRESKYTEEEKSSGRGFATRPPSLLSRRVLLWVVSVAVAIAAYGRITAMVNGALESLEVFDPYDVLQLTDVSANATTIKAAYRTLSKQTHPDKPGGDARQFQRVNMAYRVLTDDEARDNFERYGHPDGPVNRPAMDFALPEWLIRPQGATAVALVLAYLGMFVFIGVSARRFVVGSAQKQAQQDMSRSVANRDIAYLAQQLSPDSTHLQILYYLATCPEALEASQRALEETFKLLNERRAFLEKKKKGDSAAHDPLDISNDAGWADDDDDDDNEQEDDQNEEDRARRESERAAIAAAREAEKAKLREAAELAKATGRAQDPDVVRLEGLDEGVKGQLWVEGCLARKPKSPAWPPPESLCPRDARVEFKSNHAAWKDLSAKFKSPNMMLPPLEHPPVRRNLCMTMGRLNAQYLNTHPELVEAQQNGLVDASYFKATLEYRQRCAMLLEAALRIAASARSFRLAKTIVETVTMFKIGCMEATSSQVKDWFWAMMRETYGGENGIPRLRLTNTKVETADEDEVATEDVSMVVMDVERLHAENFTRQRTALCQKQGIPPEVAIQTYREGWWILVRGQRVANVDGTKPEGEESKETYDDGDDMSESPLTKILPADLVPSFTERFAAEQGENRLLCAYPFIVSNVSQKSGKIRVKFRAPSVPGKYKFYVAVKSQEFLGADQEVVVEQTVVDKESVTRKEEEEEEGEQKGDEEKDESKKEK